LADKEYMEKYKNASRNSGVLAYEIGTDWIKVKFILGREVYNYSYNKAGKHHVEEMKILAQRGKGLATYINKNVKDLCD
jgi:hypothetical protein